jgi:hypothetical protein
MKHIILLCLTGFFSHNLLCIIPQPAPIGPLVDVIIHSDSTQKAQGILEDLRAQTYQNWQAHLILPDHASINYNDPIITGLRIPGKIRISNKNFFSKPHDTGYTCYLTPHDNLDAGYLKWVAENRLHMQEQPSFFNNLRAMALFFKLLFHQ